ncbi:ParB/RepB/Spo0J family partition protein [Umezawaea tangerina]|uniref:ParB/RepB/Spo0J family partition protein n=1 Tax=Umezawaea tangerina TaxID=84725 RepID=UPI001FECDEEF|nr:ParB N-terminal domain-containing protein [Umezawaea tangerina]
MKDDVAIPQSASSASSDVESQPLRRVPIAELTGAFSPRLGGESAKHVSLLAELDKQLPPIVVHRPTMRVVDGMHRVRAAARRGEETIDAVFFDGSEDDAFVIAVELNHAHGLPLSTADRRAAADRIVVAHPEWSDRRIAAVAGLAASTVGSIRARSTDRIEQSDTRIGSDGRARPRDSAEGRRRAAELILADPEASLREVARRVGISPATVSDVRARLAKGERPERPRRRTRSGFKGRQRDDDEPLVVDSSPFVRIVGALARDPSLRGTEAGRTLLRLLNWGTTNRQHWDRLAQGVPAHQRTIVARLARESAELWQRFADQLDGHGENRPPV